MKILITTDLYKPTINGVVTSVISLRKELLKRGHDVRILTLKQKNSQNEEKNTWYIRSISAEKIYPQARILFSFGKKQMKEIFKWKPEIIHSQCEFSTFVIARKISKELKIPIVHTYHTIYEDYTHYFMPSETIGKTLVKKLSHIILSHAQAVIAPTEKIWRILKRYNVSEPVYTLPSGLDLKSASKEVSIEKLNALKKKYYIKKDKKVLLFLGRMGKEKNVSELIEFMDLLKSDDYVLVLVGDGPGKDSFEEMVLKLGLSEKVVFTGMVSRESVNEYYQMADVFVCASKSETQGLTYIEALSNGTPAVCRKDECLQEVIFNYENGFQYNTFEEFKKYLEYVLSDREIYQTMSEKARTMAQTFSISVTVKKLEVIYEKTIAEYNKQPEIEVA